MRNASLRMRTSFSAWTRQKKPHVLCCFNIQLPKLLVLHLLYMRDKLCLSQHVRVQIVGRHRPYPPRRDPPAMDRLWDNCIAKKYVYVLLAHEK
jgi:hypothetical protein